MYINIFKRLYLLPSSYIFLTELIFIGVPGDIFSVKLFRMLELVFNGPEKGYTKNLHSKGLM